MANSDRRRRRDNKGPEENPSGMDNRSQSSQKKTQGRRRDDTGTQQSEPNITRQNRGNRQNIVNQSKDESKRSSDQA